MAHSSHGYLYSYAHILLSLLTNTFICSFFRISHFNLYIYIESFSLSLCIYICVHICIYICVYIDTARKHLLKHTRNEKTKMCLKPETTSAVQAPSPSATAAVNEKLVYSESEQKPKMVTSTHSLHKRETKYDLLIFFLPALMYKFTPVLPLYLIGITRMLSTHLILTLHYIFVDKDN